MNCRIKTRIKSGALNIAAKGTASQVDDWAPGSGSQTWWGAAKAIDGNKDDNRWQMSGSNSISLTQTKGADAWWKLTFPAVYFIDSIVLWNRMDGQVQRIDGYKVIVDDTPIGTVDYEPGQLSNRFEELGVLGKVITVRSSGTENHPVQLVEVEVFGDDTVKMEAGGKEVQVSPALTSDVTISCTVSGISRKMRITWSGWDTTKPNENFEVVIGEYESEHNRQEGKLIVKRAAIGDDKIYTCTVSSEKYEDSESLSIDVHLLTYTVTGINSQVLEGENALLSCEITGLTKTATVVWKLDSKVSLYLIPFDSSRQFIIPKNVQPPSFLMIHILKVCLQNVGKLKISIYICDKWPSFYQKNIIPHRCSKDQLEAKWYLVSRHQR